MIKKVLKKYFGVLLFYLAVLGVSYALCTSNTFRGTNNTNNSLAISVNK